MKAIVFDHHGDADVLKLGVVPDLTCGTTELLVDVYATALNRADLLQRRGVYPPPEGASPLLGLEMAGIVREVGADVQGWEVGERVCALLPGGGYAEQVVIPAEMAMRIPSPLGFVEAAAIPEVWMTAYDNLFNRGRLISGETVLIHGGGSGIGTAAIQLARHRGAQVIITAGSKEKITRCVDIGAHAGIDYHGDWVDAVMTLTEGRGVDMVLDIMGASYLGFNLQALALEGRLVIIATQGGAKTDIDLLALMQKRLSVQGSTLRARPVADKAALARQVERDVLPLFSDGTFKPIIDQVFPLAEAVVAHHLMESNAHVGKIVLRVRDEQF